MCMSKRLTTNQRGRIAEKIMEWGNLVFVGLVVTQVVPGAGPFQPTMIVIGVANIAWAYVLAYVFMKGGD